MDKPIRKIIHIDMDAFFAAVEQRDFPELRHKPVIVGGLPHRRGVVAACSYEARQFGIHSAMPSSQAHRLCPDAIFIKPRFEVYQRISLEIRAIFNYFTALVEPLSLDEAYLDVSNCPLYHQSATQIAKQIKQQIFRKTGLIASAGVSYNKFLAKIASDMDKPNGLYIIKPEQGETFVEKLNIGKFHGIGKATEAKMTQLGIYIGKDLKRLSQETLKLHFGKAGLYYYNIARGIDHRSVISNRIRKSIGVETTFQEDLLNSDEIFNHLEKLLKQALDKAEAKQFAAYTLTIKVKYADFVQITRSRTLSTPINNQYPAKDWLLRLIELTDISYRKVRLLGISLSSLEASKPMQQKDLFDFA